MRTIHGNLSLMSVMDIIQWADNSKRSGTLILFQDDHQKKIYFQDGQIIFVWSDCQGERIADFLQFETLISQQKLHEVLSDSEMLGLPFIGYLYSEGIVSLSRLEEILRLVAQAALINALSWETGLFEFIDELPGFVLNGPVRLSSTQLLLESLQKFDETHQNSRVDSDRIVVEIVRNIEHGNLDLPPIPDIMQRIVSKMDSPNVSIDEIVECITDQILAAKILKICNSPFYRRSGKVTTLKDAVLFIGFKSLISIVTVHSLSSFSPRNTVEIRKVLQHCLVCGMIARQIAQDMRGDYERAFICGLLHDIGKTVMLDMLSDYLLEDDVRQKLIDGHHAEIGYLLARKWNFDEAIQESIRFHHEPERAVMHRGLVEMVYLSNIMTYSSQAGDTPGVSFAGIDLKQINVAELMERVDGLDEVAGDIINSD
ncbi:HDOD domain-containing protein [Pelobacter propionicus]|uniref:Metal dependent phosphohydrolase n=1 Tax=Pelobacter propionicus (strain DSM 2379 / NBRC 103807 / OttBd1) TaxID=338966 RepID=A1AM02_PELPD|nr:HDOD domain-containing protein [Pelobacter propionicus]ABK98372.1 metal dependent phosphohydrolase [Pelobacter propionicus DSM 2379]